MRMLLLDQTMRMAVDASLLETVRADLDRGEFPDSSLSGVFLTTGMRYEQASRDLDALGEAPTELANVVDRYRAAMRDLTEQYLAASRAVLDEDVEDLRTATDALVRTSDVARNEAIPSCA